MRRQELQERAKEEQSMALVPFDQQQLDESLGSDSMMSSQLGQGLNSGPRPKRYEEIVDGMNPSENEEKPFWTKFLRSEEEDAS